MTDKIINLNDRVEVSLTEYGFEILNEYYEQMGIGDLEYRKHPNVYGYIEFQLWQLMNIFGDKLHNGAKLPFKDNQIIYKGF